nr:MAG TPA: TFIIB zinc-binding [Caudoviricetes sp.]
MKDRCHRCYTILTSEDKHHYGIACETCECDIKWEAHERDQPIKSAYWRWRAMCFCVRILSGVAGAGRDILLQRMRNRAARRSELSHARRGR